MAELINLNFLVSDPVSGDRRKYAMPLLGSDLLISDVCQQVWENHHRSFPMAATNSRSLATKADDYGIFLYDTSGSTTKGHWLNPNKTLEDYGLTSESVIEFKAKKRVLTIRLQDQSEKKVIVDLSLRVQLLLPLICEKMGITNYEEFDFALISDDGQIDQVDSAVPAKKTGLTALVDPSNYNPATLEKRKMVRLKKKLGATEDDVAWVNQSQTLDEQGINDKDILLLRRRYFYTDRNVDTKDPIQLNLLYVQCRNAILSGMHPVTLDEALHFAGLQGQIEFQDFTEAKRGVDIRTFLPRNLNEGRKLTKKQLDDYQAKIQLEWQAHKGATELDAKDLYINKARSLKTYGMTFFLVKEKMKGRNKLIPRLFGVTRNAVLRLDEKTKETLESRPIATIQQWAVTDNTVNLDFGDYYDDRFSFQTKEGRQIAQLISGYAELIKKRQRFDSDSRTDNAYPDTSSDSQLPTYESVAAAEWKYVHTGNFLENLQKVQSGHVALPGVLRNTYADKHDLQYIGTAQARVAQIIANFAAPFRLPQPNIAQSGNASEKNFLKSTEQEFTMEHHQKAFSTSMGHVSYDVARILNISRLNSHGQSDIQNDPNNVNQEQIILDLINNLENLAGSLRAMGDTLTLEQFSNLMTSSEAFCQSFSDLLAATDPMGTTERSSEARQGVLIAVSKVGETGRLLADSVYSLDSQMSPRAAAKNKSFGWTDQEYIVYMNGIGQSAGDLVRKTKMLAAEVRDSNQQNEVIRRATELALQSAETIASTKLLRMCPKDSPDITEKTTNQLLLALDALQQALDTLQEFCRADLKLADGAQHYVSEIDKGADALSDILGKFKRDLSSSIISTQKEVVAKGLVSLEYQMREFDGAVKGTTVHHSSGNEDGESDPYRKLQANAYDLRRCLTMNNGTTSDGVTKSSPHGSLNHLLDLLRSLVHDTQAINTSGKWKRKEDRAEAIKHLKSVLKTMHQYVSQTGSASETGVEDEDNIKRAAIQAVDEFIAVLTSMQQNEDETSKTINPAQAKLAKTVAHFEAALQTSTTLQSRRVEGNHTVDENQIVERKSIVKLHSLEHDKLMEDCQHAFSTCMGNVSSGVVQLVNISRSKTPGKTDSQYELIKAHQEKVLFDLLNDLDELAHFLCEIANSITITPQHFTSLLTSGRTFCHSFSDLLVAVDLVGETKGSAEGRQGLLFAVSKVGETGRHLCEFIDSLGSQKSSDAEKNNSSRSMIPQLLSYTKQIGSDTTDLVRKAKMLAVEVQDSNVQNHIIHNTTELALQSSELIASTKLLRLCPTDNPEVTAKTTNQLLLALDALSQVINSLQTICQGDFQLDDNARSYVFEIDESAVALSDLLGKFRRDLSASTTDIQNNTVLNALLLLNHQMRDMDDAMMRNITDQDLEGTLTSSDTNSASKFSYKKIQAVTNDLRQFLTMSSDVTTTQSKSKTNNSLDELLDLLQNLIQDTLATNAAGEWKTEEERVTVLNYLKTVYETAYEYISQTDRVSGESSENNVFKNAFLEALNEFSVILNSIQENREILTETLTDIKTSLARVDENFKEKDVPHKAGKPTRRNTTADALLCLDSISEALIELTNQIKNVNPEVSHDTAALRELASEVCASYRTACDNWAVFYVLGSDLVDETSGLNIHKGLVELGHSCTLLMQTAVISSTDPTASAFPAACRDVLDKISHVQLYLNTLNCGTQSCGRALSTIEEVTEDLETAIIFASAGTVSLNTPSATDAAQFPIILPPKHSEIDFEKIIAYLQTSLGRFSEMETQQDLAAVVEDTLQATVQMVDSVRCSVAHLAYESSDAHVVALRKLRNVSMAIAAAIRLAKLHFGKESLGNDKSFKQKLVEATTVASVQVKELVQVLVDVQKPAHCRGEQLLRTVAKGLASELKNLESSTSLESGTFTTNETMDVSLNQLTISVSKIEVALHSQKQEDFLDVANFISQISAQNLFTKQTDGVDDNCHNEVEAVEKNVDNKSDISNAVIKRRCIIGFAEYLDVLVENLGSATVPSEQQKRLNDARVAFQERIAQFEASQSSKKNSKTSEHSDLSRSQVSYEDEAKQTADTLNNSLSEAAANIDRAAKKLSKVKARRTVYIETPIADFDCTVDFHDPLFEFDESVLDACKAIMRASAGLIPVAGKAQEELVQCGRVAQQLSGHYSEDGQWSQGFISAAKAIGGACQTLCDAANALMLGHATEEKLISAAKQVASFTAQLLLTCRVRGAPNSLNMKSLLEAGNTVRRSTDQLVQIFIKRRQNSPTSPRGNHSGVITDVTVNNKLVGGIAQEIKANEQVLKKERELVDAQKHLLQCRKAKYSDRHAGSASSGLHSASAKTAAPNMDELSAQENVLIKERELQEARANLLALRQLKYGINPSDEEYSGYGATSSGTLGRKKTTNLN